MNKPKNLCNQLFHALDLKIRSDLRVNIYSNINSSLRTKIDGQIRLSIHSKIDALMWQIRYETKFRSIQYNATQQPKL